jgi:hypothetical protein
MNPEQILRRRILWLTGWFIAGLASSGIPAIPLTIKLDWLTHFSGFYPRACEGEMPAVGFWLMQVRHASDVTSEQFPFPFYRADTVGITAGASTPDALIDAVESATHVLAAGNIFDAVNF